MPVNGNIDITTKASLFKKQDNVKMLHSSMQRGFSLIEVMVSLVVLSMGLLALTHLQTSSVNHSTVAYAETQSMLFLQEMVEHLRIDKTAALNGNYNIALSKFSDLATPGATDTFAEKERYNWFNNLNNALPGVKASINCVNASSLCTVEVQHEVSGTAEKQTLASVI